MENSKMDKVKMAKERGKALGEYIKSMEYFSVVDGVPQQTGNLPDANVVGREKFQEARMKLLEEQRWIRDNSRLFQYFHAESEIERAGFIEMEYANVLKARRIFAREKLGIITDKKGFHPSTPIEKRVQHFEDFKTTWRVMAEEVARAMNI